MRDSHYNARPLILSYRENKQVHPRLGTGEGERSVLSLVQVVRLVRFEIMLHSLDTLAGKLSPGGSTQNSPQSSLLDNNANRVRPYSKPPSNSNT